MSFSNENRKKTYQCYQDMKQRCNNKNSQQYKNYGGRGISVCDRWLESFDNFISDMGEKPEGMSIERINVNGNYEPKNCKWASKLEQANNRRTTRKIQFNGECLSLREWAKRIGRHETTLSYRYKQGFPTELLLSPDTLLFGGVSAINAIKGGE